MALTAVLLALSSVRNPAIPVWWTIVNLPAMLGTTLAIMTAFLMLLWHRRGLPAPSEPGHWVLVVFSVALICSILWTIAMSLSVVETGHGHRLREPEALTGWISRWGWPMSVIPTIATELWIAWKLRAERAWCWFFAACGILMLMHMLYGPVISPLVSRALQPLSSASNSIYWAIRFLLDANDVIAIVFLTWAIWIDHRRGIERHWSHWSGVLAWISGCPRQLAIAAMNVGWLEFPGI